MTDQRALDTLRRDADHYRALYRALYAVGCAAYDRIAVLERQLAETRAELSRYTRERAA